MAEEDTRERSDEPDAEELQREYQDSDEMEKAKKAEEKYESAKETMKGLEDADEPPKNLDEWPDDEAKYVTYGGAEGDHSYDEGPEAKLGPPDLERRADGSITIEGEEVDDPDEHKGEPIPGGPTDPDAPKLAGEKKKHEKMEEMYGDDPWSGENEGGSEEAEGDSKGEEEGD